MLPWFPSGKDDPSLCLISVEADEGEYRDASGVQRLKALFGGVKAYLKGTRPTIDRKQHAKVSL